MDLMVICISSLMKHLLKSFIHFLTFNFLTEFFFFVYSSVGSLYILNLSLLLHIYVCIYIKVFPHLWLTVHFLKGDF